MEDKSGVETAEAFEDYLSNIVQGGFITLAVAMGVDTGLFEVMCAMDEPQTSQEIADLAGLKERYVREWLGAMVTARIVDIDGCKETYHIPPHRIPLLNPGSGKNQFTVYATAVPMLSSVYKDVVNCFKKDGPRGIDYSQYTDFHGFMANLSGRWFDHHLIQDFVPGIDGLKEKLESGIQVLDVACGKGRAAHLFAQHYPNSQVCGVDFSQECIADAQKLAAANHLKNLHFVCHDAASMDPQWNDKFDYVFVHDAIHDQAYPDKVLGEIHRVMKKTGILSVVDTDSHTKHADNVKLGPRASMYYVCSLMNCVPVSLNFEGGMGLGAMWGKEKAVEFFLECGFEPSLNRLPGGSSIHYMCKKK